MITSTSRTITWRINMTLALEKCVHSCSNNRRHQRIVSNRRAHTQHHEVGPFGVGTSCHVGIGHQRVQTHGMKKIKLFKHAHYSTLYSK